MPLFLTALCVVTLTIQSVAIKEYNKKAKNGPVTFSAMKVFVAFFFFLVMAIAKRAVFDFEIIPYSVLFALCYGGSMVGYVLAVTCGPLSVTSVVKSYALIIPTLFGIFAWGDNVEPYHYVGFACIIVSLFLIRGDSSTEESKLSLKWLICIAISFLGEGFCSVTQKTQQQVFEEKYDDVFMVFSLIIVMAVFAVYIALRERENLKNNLKAGAVASLYGGVGNGVTNLLVLAVPNVMIGASVFYPVLSAGQVVATSLLSVFVYKEKLLPRQIVAIVLGVVAIIILNVFGNLK